MTVKEDQELFLGGIAHSYQDKEFVSGGDDKEGRFLTAARFLITILMLPATMLHELTHYVVARLLGFEVSDVVLFQFSSRQQGMVLIPAHEAKKTIRYNIVLASPLLTCGCVWLSYVLYGYTHTSTLFEYLIASTLMTGFFVGAIPDQIREQIPL